jgi:hypothetical protein
MEIKESDWKIFRKFHDLALERYCQRVLAEVRLTVDNDAHNYHERYLNLWELMRSRDKTAQIAFDDPRRSQMIIQLANIVAEALLTEAELNEFSEETRERIEGITSLRDR